MDTTDITTVTKELEDRYQVDCYAKLPIVVDRGEGCYVYDSTGKAYLDLYGGHAVTSTGHCHPRVVRAVQEQLSRLIFYSNATYNSARAGALEKLIEMSKPFARAFLVNSGAEANENAIKLARGLTGRREVLSAEGAFHGRTYASLSSTGIPNYRAYLNTPVPGHTILPYELIAEQVSERTAAVLLEPIQSMGGVRVIPPEIIQRIEDSCGNSGALLIFDEIQTGLGRTGSFLYSQKLGAAPDMTTLAKGIASGIPAGAVLLTEQLADQVNRGDLGSTFGGSPLACSALLATLEVIQDENLLDNVQGIGSYLRKRLSSNPQVREIRGEGLLVGITFIGHTAKEVQKILFEAGVLSGTSYDPAVLRLMPPLTLGREEVDHFVAILESL